METSKKIDYTKFRCQVFSPDGAFVKEAVFNQKHEFYCPELVPGQKYFLVFTYDEMFVDCISFNCPDDGKVVYLSTSHLFFNKDYEILPQVIAEVIKPQIEKANLYHWNRRTGTRRALDAFIHSTHDKSFSKKRKTRHALDAFIESTHEGAKKQIDPNQIKAYKAGADLANKVK